MIINKVDDKVGEPGILTLWLEQTAEQAQALLSEMIAENLERHKSGVLVETLCKESQTEILDVIVGHV